MKWKDVRMTMDINIIMRVKDRIPQAGMKGYFNSAGTFLGWRIVDNSTKHREAISGLHKDYEAAWDDAAGRLGGDACFAAN